jgi:L-Ala-D/L-Glu epimerase
VKVKTRFIRARLRAPFVSARAAVEDRELLLLSLTGGDGVTGYGEAAPLEIPLDAVRAALEDCRPILEEADDTVPLSELLAACERVAVLRQALAAVDLALWDQAGRRAGQPVWRLLQAPSGDSVAVNATVATPDRAGAATAAAAARAAGFAALKLKVGTGDDAGRLAAVRAAAGPQMAIRLDANGVWSVPEALATLRALEPAGIELCEEPVSGLDALERVSAETSVSVALDESAALPGALERRVGDAVCLKIVRCGGISGVLEAARRARHSGYDVYLASTLDGPLGIAGALHAAAALRPRRACGLATLGLFEPPDPLPARDGRIELPPGPGLGDGLLGWYGALDVPA